MQRGVRFFQKLCFPCSVAWLPESLPDRLPDRLPERVPERQTDKQTDRQTDKQTDRQTNRQTDGHFASSCYAITIDYKDGIS